MSPHLELAAEAENKAYEMECPHCKQAYHVNAHVQLIPIEKAGDIVKTPDIF